MNSQAKALIEKISELEEKLEVELANRRAKVWPGEMKSRIRKRNPASSQRA